MELANESLLDNDLYSNMTAGRSLQSMTGCKKPKNVIAQSILFGNPIKLAKDAKKYKADMKNYKACIENYKAQVEASKDAVAQAQLREAEAIQKVEDAKAELEASKNSQTSESRTSDATEEKKFLGMPQTTGIVVTSIVGLGLIIGAVVIIKKLNLYALKVHRLLGKKD